MQYKVVGICNVKVKMFEEIVKNKGNVRHVLKLGTNLISLGRLK